MVNLCQTLSQLKNIFYLFAVKYHYFFNSFVDCLSGYYGHRCEKVCSGHCLNNTICDYIDGKCSDGCQPGYIGKLCYDCKIFMPSFICTWLIICERYHFLYVPVF